MNQERIEQLLLLEQSGELSAEERIELHDALQDPDIQDLRDRYAWLVESAQNNPLPYEGSEIVTQHILAEADRVQRSASNPWSQLAVAAALVLLLAGTLLVLNGNPKGVQLAESPPAPEPQPTFTPPHPLEATPETLPSEMPGEDAEMILVQRMEPVEKNAVHEPMEQMVDLEAALDEFAALFNEASEGLMTFDTSHDPLEQFSQTLLAYNE